MSVAIRSLALVGTLLCVACLPGCGSSSYGSAAGTSATLSTGGGSSGGASATGGFNSGGGMITGTHDSIVATPESNLVSVQVGQKHTVPVTFTSSDGATIRGFGLTNASLPAGWSGPTAFGCATVTTGSSCVLNLVYAPTAFEMGKTVTLSYLYVDSSGTPVTNATAGALITMSFNYQATTDDNVTTAVAPAGQLQATTNSGGSPVTVTFQTDDAHPASNLQITASTLPPGFMAPTTGCDTVSAGTPCALTWLYQPTVPDSGSITLEYTYADDSGSPKSGTFNIPYVAASDDHVTYAVDPVANPIDVAAGSSQVVTVTFITDDGYPATNLTTDPTMDISQIVGAFPGWSTSGPVFQCATVDGGTGCQMTLYYNPQVAGATGTVQFNYSYTNNAGIQTPNASVNINFQSH